MQQRALALNTVAKIIRRVSATDHTLHFLIFKLPKQNERSGFVERCLQARRGEFTDSVQTPIIPALLDGGLVFILRWSLDDTIDTTIAAAVNCFHSLLVSEQDEVCVIDFQVVQRSNSNSMTMVFVWWWCSYGVYLFFRKVILTKGFCMRVCVFFLILEFFHNFLFKPMCMRVGAIFLSNSVLFGWTIFDWWKSTIKLIVFSKILLYARYQMYNSNMVIRRNCQYILKKVTQYERAKSLEHTGLGVHVRNDVKWEPINQLWRIKYATFVGTKCRHCN